MIIYQVAVPEEAQTVVKEVGVDPEITSNHIQEEGVPHLKIK